MNKGRTFFCSTARGTGFSLKSNEMGFKKNIFKFTQIYKLTWKRKVRPLTENLLDALPLLQ